MKTVDTEEKISFVLYGSYEESLNMLTDEQAGKLIKSIYTYVRTGEKCANEPLVAMLFSMISHQLDIDARKYAESKARRKEAAKIGGRASAEKRAKQKAMEQQTQTMDSDCQRFQPVDVDEDVNVDVDVDVDVDADVDADVDVLNTISGDGGEDVVQAREIIYFADMPTVQRELDKFHSFAQELFVRYSHHQPGQYDLEQVFVNTYSRRELDEDTAIAAFDPDKAELLRYAFQQAANADKVTWGYINGIYNRFAQRGIKTVMDAQRYNWELKHDYQGVV